MTDRLDLLLTEYHQPEPAPAAVCRRISTGASSAARDLDRFIEEIAIEATDRGITGVRPGRLRLPPRAGQRRLVERAREQLAEFFHGRRAFFSVPVDLRSIPRFQLKVLRETSRIPFGEARSYSWLARRIGHPRAARAVGTALGRNPVPFIVPCHRILREDGSLGGYGLGIAMKRRLLALERITPVLEGCTSTGVLCRVGCCGTRRTRPDRIVVFASVADARSVGYRPCRTCIPREFESRELG